MFSELFIFLITIFVINCSNKCTESINNNVESYTFIRCSNVQNISEITADWSKYTKIHLQIVIEIDPSFSLEGTSDTDLSKIERLDLSNVGQLIVPDRGFNVFPNIHYLNISNCGLNEIKSEWFSTLKLLILDFSRNKLKTLNAFVVRHLSNIQELYLAHNILDTIEEYTFSDLQSLSILNLEFNHLKYLNITIPSATKLIINDNFLREITYPCMEYSSTLALYLFPLYLEELNLSGNKIETIVFGVFKCIRRVINNDINYVTRNDIKILNLSRNRIIELRRFPMPHLGNLESLILSDNQIYFIEENFFKFAPSLTYLDLSRNRLQYYSNNAFSNRNNALETLILSGNYLKTIDAYVLNTTPNVINFNISKNLIVYIDPLFKGPNKPLRMLDVSHNFLEEIPNALTFDIVHLKEFYISHNRLTFFPNLHKDWGWNVQLMSIEGNPWQCHCLDELMTLLSTKKLVFWNNLYFNGKKPACIHTEFKYCIKDVQFIRNLHIVERYERDEQKFINI